MKLWNSRSIEDFLLPAVILSKQSNWIRWIFYKLYSHFPYWWNFIIFFRFSHSCRFHITIRRTFNEKTSRLEIHAEATSCKYIKLQCHCYITSGFQLQSPKNSHPNNTSLVIIVAHTSTFKCFIVSPQLHRW